MHVQYDNSCTLHKPQTIHDTSFIFAQFKITADLIPPPLADESYYCVFGDLGSSVVEGNLISGVNFTDLTCNYSFTIRYASE